MGDFYRRDKVEEVALRHPDLLEFVNQSIRQRVPYPEIAAAVLEQWDEELSPQVISNHKNLRVLKQQEAEMKVYIDSLGQGRALVQLQKENPTAEREEMIATFVDVGIITQKQRLMEAEPLKLMAERRKQKELEQRDRELDIENGKLQVAVQNAETAKLKAEAELAQLKQKAEEAIDEVQGQIASGKSPTAEDIQRLRERLIGGPP